MWFILRKCSISIDTKARLAIECLSMQGRKVFRQSPSLQKNKKRGRGMRNVLSFLRNLCKRENWNQFLLSIAAYSITIILFVLSTIGLNSTGIVEAYAKVAPIPQNINSEETMEVINIQPDKTEKLVQTQADNQQLIQNTTEESENIGGYVLLSNGVPNRINNGVFVKTVITERDNEILEVGNFKGISNLISQSLQGISEERLQDGKAQAEMLSGDAGSVPRNAGIYNSTVEQIEPSSIINATLQGTEVVGLEQQKEEQLQEKLVEETLAKKKQEKTSVKSKNIKKEKKKNKIILSKKDKSVLLRIVEAEATGEDIKGKMLVANVILNRVNKKDEFPNNVTAVVFEKTGNKYQFSPIGDGRYWDVSISKDTKKAVERVLNGEDESKGALYFMARKYANPKNVAWFDNSLTWLFQHGVHEFYK